MNIILFEEMPELNLIDVKDERAQHILNILKLGVGQSFKMGILNKSEGISTITSITDKAIEFSYQELEKPSMYPVTLLVAQVRPICMKRILREAVSLGVKKIILTSSETGEKSYSDSNLYKSGEYKDYLLDGAMQSSHAGISEVVFAKDVKEAVSMVDKKDNLILLDNILHSSDLSKAQLSGPSVLAIGPERGWSDMERRIFINAGFKPMLLGNRVLRTETACSCGVAVLLSRLGYM